MDKQNFVNSETPETYASILKNIEQREKSTSGGVFYSIASWIIDNGGIVFGASLSSDFQVHHIGVETIEELQKLCGSKYVQSDIADTFFNVKANLNTDRWVYFVGTGCQVAGLKSYLKSDYKKLLTSDLVCHGVPSQDLFDCHIKYLQEKHNGVILSYNFRDNKSGLGAEIYEYSKNGKIKKVTNPSYETSPYLYSFMHGLTLRSSCYECKFAHIPRQGDITLGDYWGVKNIIPQIDSSKGVSLIMLNNEKGRMVLREIKSKLFLYPTKLDHVIAHNPQVVKPTDFPQIRESIFNKIKVEGYNNVANSYFKSPHKFKIIFLYRLKKVGLFRVIINFIRNITIRNHQKY